MLNSLFRWFTIRYTAMRLGTDLKMAEASYILGEMMAKLRPMMDITREHMFDDPADFFLNTELHASLRRILLHLLAVMIYTKDRGMWQRHSGEVLESFKTALTDFWPEAYTYVEKTFAEVSELLK